MTDDYEAELTASREEAATVLHGLADGVAAGAVRLGSGDDERIIDVPDRVDLEIEFEAEDGELGLEADLAWPEDATEQEARADAEADTDGLPGEEPGADEPDDRSILEDTGGIAEPAVGAAAQQVSLGRFELFEDRAGEWRWRLVHRNGNVIATSGEGYTRKHNARKGLRSVMRNAEGAEVTGRPDE